MKAIIRTVSKLTGGTQQAGGWRDEGQGMV